ncbi:MAG: prolipoprotein diacylglyceryl transferase [Akkermansia sp.]
MNNVFATYIHDLNPVLLQLGESIAIRWYGLAYLTGFIAGYLLLKYLSRRKLYPVPEEKLGDFITWAAVFGVLIGGRIGYVLFYQIPNKGWELFTSDPMSALRIWEGGMASHGGIIGILLFALYYARRHQYSWLAITDGLAIVAPVGLFFGRIANFINGELYGRIIHDHSAIGMKFPTEFYENIFLRNEALNTITQKASPEIIAQLNASTPIPKPDDYHAASWLVERVRDTPQIKELIGSALPERYPSQLYEGLAEGLILFAALWAVRIFWKKAYNGIFCGIFCILYAIGRIIVENYREPDSPVWFNLTRGQYLSFFLIFLGIGFIIYAFRKKESPFLRTINEEKI